MCICMRVCVGVGPLLVSAIVHQRMGIYRSSTLVKVVLSISLSKTFVALSASMVDGHDPLIDAPKCTINGRLY